MKYRKELQQKIDKSVALIQEWEEVAINLNNYGYFVGFSGGKDSQAVLRCVEIAGVKHKTVYNNTTNDDPENIRFIRSFYPNVVISNPPKNFFKLIEEQGLPTMTTRYCCKVLKEYSSNGTVSITGVRKEESLKRSKYVDVEIRSNRKPYENQFHILQKKDDFVNDTQKKIRKNDTLKVQPILDWTEQDVWEFVEGENLPINPLYESVGRIGCMFCPFSTTKTKEFYSKKYPKFKQLLLRSIERNMEKRGDSDFKNAEEKYEWWCSGMSVKCWLEKNKQQKLNF